MATYKDMLLDIIQPTTERQYGGGLDDAYMTLSQRRDSAFADPNANSAFASPMSQGGLPTIYREDGGTTIPKERMINDQPHQLSYINPEEAGLLQALGGSGRMVDGVPSYFWSGDGSGYAAGGEEGFGENTGDGANYDGPYDMSVQDLEQEDRDTGSAKLGDTAPSYVTVGETGTPSEEASAAAERENAARFADIGLDMQQKYGGDAGNRLTNYAGRRGNLDLLSPGAYNKLVGIPWVNDSIIANMTAPQLSNFQAAFDGKSFGGDMGANDFSKGYRFGGAEGTLQDILERGLQGQFNIDDLLGNDEKKKKDATEQEREGQELSTAERVANGVQGFYDNISNLLSVKSDLDPSTLSNIEARAKEQGLTYTPSSNVLGNIINFGVGMLPGGNVIKGLASLTGGGKTIGTVTNEAGMSFNLSDTGKMSMIENPTFDAQDTTGSDNDSVSARRSRPVPQKITKRVTDEVIKTPDIPDDRTIKERGLLPQYEALRRAKYTKEDAIQAVGAPAGTALT